ncbi:IclR family transcriptional regulator [Nocardioides sambongensis]|uniref:IclR family transcriptional regulator n=1 Tax=Nocardioides sambongensis TaxID=2589074 RepID=UPI00112B6359|nr:IclR family transcriptional regulator [Nocardioides sambongensis]
MSLLAVDEDQASTAAATDAKDGRTLPPSMVERMTLILEAFASPSTRLTLEQVARATHLPRSTAHRILDQLVRLEWLSHSPFGYSLGTRSLGLGGTGGSHLELREAAAGPLHELLIRTGLVAHLAVLDGAEIHYLDKMGGRFAGVVPSRVGGRAPAHCTALGKAMLAWMSAEEVDEQIAPAIGRNTSRSIGDVGTLHQELTRIRGRHGIAFERGECFPEIACVAAAVRGPEGAVGAISLVGDAGTQLERVAPLVLDAARQATRTLFPDLQIPGTQAPRRVRAPRGITVTSPSPRQGRRTVTAAELADERWSAQALDRMVAAGESGDWF